MSNTFKPENPELWEICSRHGAILAKREKVTQIAILDLYDEVLKLTSSYSDYVKCASDLIGLFEWCGGSHPDDIIEILKKHFA